jgi:hypothetical protein
VSRMAMNMPIITTPSGASQPPEVDAGAGPGGESSS